MAFRLASVRCRHLVIPRSVDNVRQALVHAPSLSLRDLTPLASDARLLRRTLLSAVGELCPDHLLRDAFHFTQRAQSRCCFFARPSADIVRRILPDI